MLKWVICVFIAPLGAIMAESVPFNLTGRPEVIVRQQTRAAHSFLIGNIIKSAKNGMACGRKIRAWQHRHGGHGQRRSTRHDCVRISWAYCPHLEQATRAAPLPLVLMTLPATRFPPAARVTSPSCSRVRVWISHQSATGNGLRAEMKNSMRLWRNLPKSSSLANHTSVIGVRDSSIFRMRAQYSAADDGTRRKSSDRCRPIPSRFTAGY